MKAFLTATTYTNGSGNNLSDLPVVYFDVFLSVPREDIDDHVEL